jgi:hypothetical protein
MSIFTALVKLSRRSPASHSEDNDQPRLKRRDQRSARAKARNAAHRRALARAIGKQTKFAPKRRWTTPSFRTGWRPPPGASVLDRIVRSRRPGRWYARSDLGNLAGLTDGERIGVRLFSHGYLTRRRNPEFVSRQVDACEPQYLHTLTPVGEQSRSFLLTGDSLCHVALRTESEHS